MDADLKSILTLISAAENQDPLDNLTVGTDTSEWTSSKCFRAPATYGVDGRAQGTPPSLRYARGPMWPKSRHANVSCNFETVSLPWHIHCKNEKMLASSDSEFSSDSMGTFTSDTAPHQSICGEAGCKRILKMKELLQPAHKALPHKPPPHKPRQARQAVRSHLSISRPRAQNECIQALSAEKLRRVPMLCAPSFLENLRSSWQEECSLHCEVPCTPEGVHVMFAPRDSLSVIHQM